MRFSIGICLAALQVSVSTALTISQINGYRFQSEYDGKTVKNVKGLVTAKGPQGFWLKSTTLDLDIRSSNSIYVFNTPALRNVTVGDIITLDANVTEYRSSPAYLYLTELIQPLNIKVLSSGNKITPIVIGEWLLKYPPTEFYSSLDNWDVFGVPNNVSQISVKNPALNPLLYGLDFWESLSGEIVKVKKVKAVGRPNNFGDTWVTGSWFATNRNKRGGLTAYGRGKFRSGLVTMRAILMLSRRKSGSHSDRLTPWWNRELKRFQAWRAVWRCHWCRLPIFWLLSHSTIDSTQEHWTSITSSPTCDQHCHIWTVQETDCRILQCRESLPNKATFATCSEAYHWLPEDSRSHVLTRSPGWQRSHQWRW